MSTMSKSQFLFSGTEVVTIDKRIAFVDQYLSAEQVVIRYHNPPWPFPEWDTKTRKQLKPVEHTPPEALW